MGLALLASMILLGAPDPSVLEIQFDSSQNWPKDLAVLRGTVLRLEGKADSGRSTDFIVRSNGRVVGETATSLSWSIDWSTRDAPSGPSVLEIAFRKSGGDENLLAHIYVQVLERSPFAFEVTGTALNGDPLLRLSAGTKEAIRSVCVEYAGKSLPSRPQSDGTYRLSISGMPPGRHAVSVFAIASSGAAFESGSLEFTVAERVSFKDPKPLLIERTPDIDGNAVRLDCTFPDGLSASSVNVDLKPGGLFIPKDRGGQVLLTVDSLPEGTRQIALLATGPDGTVYLSTPRELTVHSNAAYVTFRALQNCQPVFEDCAQYLQGVIAQAADVDLAVRKGGAGPAADEEWDAAQQEIAAAILSARGQEPEGLSQADTGKVVPALNHVFENWLLYGAILARSMSDSWKSVRVDDFSRFSEEVQSRVRSLQAASESIRNSDEARQNLISAYSHFAGELQVERLQIADSFTVDSKVTGWIKQRAGVLRAFANASMAVNKASSLDVDTERAYARAIRSIRPDALIADGSDQMFSLAMDAWGISIEEMAHIKEYTGQKQRLLDQYSGDPTNASDTDKQRLAQFDQMIDASARRRDDHLKVGLTLASQILNQERVAVTRSES